VAILAEHAEDLPSIVIDIRDEIARDAEERNSRVTQYALSHRAENATEGVGRRDPELRLRICDPVNMLWLSNAPMGAPCLRASPWAGSLA
jgi:hypothetical protein